MFDIGAFELLIVGIIALVVVGPEELPRLVRAAGALVKKLKGYSREFRAGLDDLAKDATGDEFDELRRIEGITKDMSAEDITRTIMANRTNENDDGDKDEDAGKASGETSDDR